MHTIFVSIAAKHIVCLETHIRSTIVEHMAQRNEMRIHDSKRFAAVSGSINDSVIHGCQTSDGGRGNPLMIELLYMFSPLVLAST